MKFINFTIVKLSIFFSLGILIAYSFQESTISYFEPLLICLLVLGVSWFFARKQLFQTVYFGILSYSCFFLLGCFSFQKQLPDFQKNHYIHEIKNDSETIQTLQVIEIKIKEVLKPDRYNSKYIADVIQLEKSFTNGKILLNIPKDESLASYTIDDHLTLYSSFSEIKTPLNPHQFNYAKYMKSLGVYHQLRVDDEHILFQKKGESTLKGIAERYRNQIILKLKAHAFNPNELSIIQALLLGQKRDIDKKLYEDYAAAGAIHILAISGLHVGIIFMMLTYLFSFLTTFPKGKIIKSILVLLILWGFALMAGLSPSVVRAVTMFSFFAIADSLERPTNSFNTLFLSYLFLLLLKPLWLFHVGFQMSYLAVFFILWIQPKLYKYYIPTFYFDKLIWSILTVTIAAQIGILPLSIFYFHQFPGLSFLTNLIILPFLGIILGGGILIIVLALCNILPDKLAVFYNYLIELLNAYISWTANQDQFLIQDIFFTEGKLITFYLLIICTIMYWKRTNFRHLTFVLICFILVISNNIWDAKNTSKNELIFFNKNRNTLIGLKEENTLRVFDNDTLKNYRNEYPIKGYRVSENINNYSEHQLPKIWAYNQKRVMVIDSLGIYTTSSLIDVVLLIESPKINLNRLIDSLLPKQIIVNGSNYPYLKKEWKITCEKRGILFYDIYEEGAFILK
ncbi:MAG: competence protein ComEC family protein [Flavobacteriaceae bacterium]|nr:competence protein ComEC family protein [Flavobacteriaceae bacterium]